MTTPRPPSLTTPPLGYADWLAELKARLHGAQQRAALAVNRELVALYWQMGSDILQRQAREGWGAKVIARLAHDLCAFAEAWPDQAIGQQLVGHLACFHPLALRDKLDSEVARCGSAAQAIAHRPQPRHSAAAAATIAL